MNVTNAAAIPTRTLTAVLLDRRNESVLLERSGMTLRLPSLAVAATGRVAFEVQEAIYKTYSLKCLVLESFIDEVNGSFVVCELLSRPAVLPLIPVPLHEYFERSTATTLISRLRHNIEGDHPFFFSRVGWLDDVLTWIAAVTGGQIDAEAEIVQLKGGPKSFLASFQTLAGSKYWMKATTGEHFHEGPLTEYLVSLRDRYETHPCPVGRFIARHAAWNAWLMAAHEGDRDLSSLSPCERYSFFISAAKSLAAIQVTTYGKEKGLLRIRAFDHRCESMLKWIPAMRPYLIRAMEKQTSTKAPQLSNRRIEELCDAVQRVLEDSRTRDIPVAILHGDLNPGNVIWNGSSVRFIDWSEAWIGPCCISLQHLLLLHSATDDDAPTDTATAVLDAYVTVWSPVVERSTLEHGLVSMELLAAFSALLGRGLPKIEGSQSEAQLAYVRTLTRHIDRAAARMQLTGAFA